MIDRVKQLQDQYLSVMFCRRRLWLACQDATPETRPGITEKYKEAVTSERRCRNELRAAMREAITNFEEVA